MAQLGLYNTRAGLEPPIRPTWHSFTAVNTGLRHPCRATRHAREMNHEAAGRDHVHNACTHPTAGPRTPSTTTCDLATQIVGTVTSGDARAKPTCAQKTRAHTEHGPGGRENDAHRELTHRPEQVRRHGVRANTTGRADIEPGGGGGGLRSAHSHAFELHHRRALVHTCQHDAEKMSVACRAVRVAGLRESWAR